jgi:hypothetical protein
MQNLTDVDDVIFLALDFFIGQAVEIQRALRVLFDSLDEDGSGTLNWEEFRRFGESMTKVHRNNERTLFTDDELLSIFKRASRIEDDGDSELNDSQIVAIACYQAGMYHPPVSFEFDEKSEESVDEGADSP